MRNFVEPRPVFGSSDLASGVAASEAASAADPFEFRSSTTPSSPEAVFKADCPVLGILPVGLGDGENTLTYSMKPVALVADPANLQTRRLRPKTNLVAAATFSRHEGALLAAGFSKDAATIAAPWMRLLSSADGDMPPSSGPSVIWATCTERTELKSFRMDTAGLEPHPSFVSAVKNAMGAGEADSRAQLHALRRVLAAWGPVLATRVTLGCALTTSMSWMSSESSDVGAVWAAERHIRNAVLCNVTQRPVGSTPAEKADVEGLATQLWFSRVGGSPGWTSQENHKPDLDSIVNENHWEVIRIDEALATIDLLERCDSDLYRKVRELVDSVMPVKIHHAKVVTPPAPVFHFPGRLAAYKYQNPEPFHMNAFVQQDLPDFDPIADFTVCAWILSGNQGSNSMALCIECFELTHSLLCIGEWDHDGHLQAVVYHGENICMRGKGGSLPRGEWLHVVVTQSRDELSFYIDGRLEDTKRWKALEAAETASRVRICLGRSAFENKAADQWDGAIENAKFWSRALSEDEVSREAHVKNRPTPGHWGASRY